MALKVEKEKMRILHHGNDEGFSMVEAVVSIFVAAGLLLAVIGFVLTTTRYSDKIINRVDSYIIFQNDYAENTM